jgi:preflagellin peptidase FlaK
MVPTGIVLLLYDFVQNYASNWFYFVRWVIFSVAFIYIFMYLLFRMHAFGGADAKFFISLSVLFPFYPNVGTFPLLGPSPVNLFAFSVFGNTLIIIAFVVPVYLFLYNTFKWKKIEVLSFIGYKIKISEIKNKWIKLIEKHEEVDGKVTRKFKFGGMEIDDAVVEKLRAHYGENGTVWVTPKLPTFVFIIFGFAIAAFYGDLMFLIEKWAIFHV